MITLITGVPGAGKTQNAIKLAMEYERDGRTVYFKNIPALKLGWVELEDATEWPSLPERAVVIIDEAQEIYRPRHYSKEVPKHVQALETHRHSAYDIILMTQAPGLVDSNVRRLVGRHWHFIRKSWANASTRYEWTQCHDNVDPPFSDAVGVVVPDDKSVYKLYKSAIDHTHKKRLPQGSKYLVYGLLAVFALLFLFYGELEKLGAPKLFGSEKPQIASAAKTNATPVPRAPSVEKKGSQAVLTDVEYIERRRPRIAGLAYTAPAYDSVTAVTTAPFPAACIEFANKPCRCYTDQATVLEVDDQLCRSIVARGYFREFGQEKGQLKGGDARVAGVPPIAASRPSSTPPMELPASPGPPPSQLAYRP